MSRAARTSQSSSTTRIAGCHTFVPTSLGSLGLLVSGGTGGDVIATTSRICERPPTMRRFQTAGTGQGIDDDARSTVTRIFGLQSETIRHNAGDGKPRAL